ncbi:MAG TPA: alpha/beta fold hydrolase [Thermoanaerobaculia bacterium]|nr:alpha/beta fold hydrolase [Thermoanaerobaculia bacterium]
MKRLLLSASLLLGSGLPAAAEPVPEPASGDHVIPNFRFATGETLAQLKIHYRTLGSPRRDSKGIVRNAVLLLHGTTGSGKGFFSENFAGVLFGPGQLLDSEKYYLIVPDGIGHGESSRPSDGLRARFPRYNYDDMVEAERRLLTEGLNVNHLRLIIGTSMGAMHCWIWGEKHPDFMDGLLPLAAVPARIVGRNRMFRKMVSDDIRNDPEWKNGDYASQPRGLTAAVQVLLFMVSTPLAWQKSGPTPEEADRYLAQQMQARGAGVDANNFLYAFEASRDYDPSPDLEKITAPVLAINFADDVVNPPELGLMEKLMPRVKRGRYVLIPTSPETRGHTTHSWPAVWSEHLRKFLEELPAS